jgi:hypothetical protein
LAVIGDDIVNDDPDPEADLSPDWYRYERKGLGICSVHDLQSLVCDVDTDLNLIKFIYYISKAYEEGKW